VLVSHRKWTYAGTTPGSKKKEEEGGGEEEDPFAFFPQALAADG